MSSPETMRLLCGILQHGAGRDLLQEGDWSLRRLRRATVCGLRVHVPCSTYNLICTLLTVVQVRAVRGERVQRRGAARLREVEQGVRGGAGARVRLPLPQHQPHPHLPRQPGWVTHIYVYVEYRLSNKMTIFHSLTILTLLTNSINVAN